MPFPTATRVIYEQNPLEEVICQLKFPTILRIDAEPPAAFQEALRLDYPRYSTEGGLNLKGLPPEVAQLAGSVIQNRVGVSHKVTNEAGDAFVVLTRDFLALTVTKYDRWEHFRARMEQACRAFEAAFQPGFYSRVGLRYRDVIRPAALGLEGTPWHELLGRHVAGELASPAVTDDIEEVTRQVLFKLPGRGKVRLQHGTGVDDKTKERVYYIDFDLFVDGARTPPGEVTEVLDGLHDQGRRLFHWAISKRLHEALRPRPLD